MKRLSMIVLICCTFTLEAAMNDNQNDSAKSEEGIDSLPSDRFLVPLSNLKRTISSGGGYGSCSNRDISPLTLVPSLVSKTLEEFLLDEEPTDEGFTPFHKAIINFDNDTFDQLFKDGVDLEDNENTNKKTPLHVAVEVGNVYAVKKLLFDVKINIALWDSQERMPCQLTSKKNGAEIQVLFDMYYL